MLIIHLNLYLTLDSSTPLPIEVTPFEIIIFFNFEYLKNAYSPIEFTVFGILIFVNGDFLKNDYYYEEIKKGLI